MKLFNLLETLQILWYNNYDIIYRKVLAMIINNFKYDQNILNSNFEIHHYKEDNFQPINFHSHEFYEIYFFINGYVTYNIEDVSYTLHSGDILVIPPNKMHRPFIKSGITYERIVLWLNADIIDNNNFPSLHQVNDIGVYLIDLSSEENRFVQNLLDLLVVTARTDNFDYQQSLIMTFLHYCSTNFENSISKRIVSTDNKLIIKAIDYINSNFTKPITLDEISNALFISKFHLSHKFKEFTNLTVYDYVLDKRLELASRLILNGESANSVSEKTGFKNYSNFYKAFHNKFDVSPREFKNANLN